MQKPICEFGRSMIEMLGVLAIIAVLSVGGIAGYSKAMEQFKISKSIDYISQIVSNVQTTYATQKTYSELSSNRAMDLGIYPQNNYQLPLGGNTSVLLAPSEDGAIFGLRICGLTERQCVALTTQHWGSSSSTGLYGVSINLAHNFLNGASGIKQNGQGCEGTYDRNDAYFSCANNGQNVITHDIANKHCRTGSKDSDGNLCMGLFYR